MAFSPEEAVVALGTSRPKGNTRLAVDEVLAGRQIDVVNLSGIDISAYDHEHLNARDDFIPLIETIVAKSFWVLASPVYWYAMSAQMKMFVDRLGDLVTIRKDLGHQLRGKSVAVIASGVEDKLPRGFESPFRLTCKYLGMEYIGAHYSQFDDGDRPHANVERQAHAIGASWIS